jgi:hypothetical protein
MATLIPSLAVAFSAFCVWLTVRIVNRRERWAKWTAVIVIILVFVGYPLSFGPANWLVVNEYVPEWLLQPIEEFYRPLALTSAYAPQPVGNILVWYTKLWLPND